MQDIEQYLNNENRKELEVVSVRLENIKLNNRLKKQEAQLKSKVTIMPWWAYCDIRLLALLI